ncbi:MAG: cation-translocating P-type ATPase [Acidimicrobiales bacterium]
MTTGSTIGDSDTPPANGSEPSPPWHALDVATVERELTTGVHGLGPDEVERRRARFGPNALEEEPPTPLIVVLLRQFTSPLIYLLLAATVVTLALGEYVDSAVIAAVLVLNAVIGLTQERHAEGAVRALMSLIVPRARVVRDHHEQEIDSRQLVPGDMVLLEPGSRVPADLRLTHTSGLQIDESLLTGESMPVSKRTDPAREDAPLSDRTSMAFTGSVVTAGRGRGAVVAIGQSTELGAIAGMIRDEGHEPTPLQRRMAEFAKIVGIAVGIGSVVAFASGVALGAPTGEMFLTAVALAVAAIPEGLPVVFTITLALGVRRMARRNAIIRRLPAVETLGSTTVIGSDKTGTLTQNRMQVQALWAGGETYRVTGEEEHRCIVADDERPVALDEHPTLRATMLAGVLANEASVYLSDDTIATTGDPTEVGLLLVAWDGGIEPEDVREQFPSFAEIPFEPELRYSASVRWHGEDHVLFVKGAPEQVARMCTHIDTGDGHEPLDPDAVHRAAADMAQQGLRVLAMASKRLTSRLDDGEDLGEPEGLIFLGLQGMHDPPRAGVPEAIARCQTAGIRVIMITGDHATTALAIATDLGITDNEAVVAGTELDELSDDDLRAELATTSVFARIAPEGKLRIVRALQDLDEVVAVTGDGVNDAPALKAAAIGVAMGRSGTDVAREASDMVLTDDDFVSITAAVEEGRITFDNLRNATFFLISTGAATILAIVAGVWLQWPLLMLPAQLLWLNLVTNGLQDVALAFEPGERDVLARAPRPRREGILSKVLWERVAVVGVLMAAGALTMFRWTLDRTDSLPQAQTVALTTMVVFMAFHAGNSRSAHRSLLSMSPVSNPFLFIATIAALGVHIAALYLPPTQFVLRVEPFDPDIWWRIVATAATVLVAVEAHKRLRRPRPTPEAGNTATERGGPRDPARSAGPR